METIKLEIDKLELKQDDILVLNFGKNFDMEMIETYIKSIRELVDNRILVTVEGVEVSVTGDEK